MEAPRHTTQQIADDVATGMDPNAECVASMYYDAVVAERDEWKRRCERRDDIVSRERAEAEIALRGLRAELARVKAESLRVVVDGEACRVLRTKIGSCFEHLGNVYRNIGGEIRGDASEINARQLMDGSANLFDGDTIVQPVCLKRWEDADVLGE